MPDTMAAANANLEKRGHPFVGTSANVDDWKKGLPFEVPLFEPGVTEYLLWLGCAPTYEERAQNIARATAQRVVAGEVTVQARAGPGRDVAVLEDRVVGAHQLYDLRWSGGGTVPPAATMRRRESGGIGRRPGFRFQ